MVIENDELGLYGQANYQNQQSTTYERLVEIERRMKIIEKAKIQYQEKKERIEKILLQKKLFYRNKKG